MFFTPNPEPSFCSAFPSTGTALVQYASAAAESPASPNMTTILNFIFRPMPRAFHRRFRADTPAAAAHECRAQQCFPRANPELGPRV